MINGLNVLAVIPARGGSKGVHLKNLRKINGVPIVEIAAQTAMAVDYIDCTIVSTDHPEIAEAAKRGGAQVPFLRPKDLSGDRVSDLEVLTHALVEMEKDGDRTYDILVMLQPTSPMRSAQHVIDAIEMLVNSNFDSVWTVSETETKSHPLKQLVLRGNNLSYYKEEGAKIIARQQLEPVYHRNGIAYAVRRDCIVKKESIMGDSCGALICDGPFISIDTEMDFVLTNYFLKLNGN